MDSLPPKIPLDAAGDLLFLRQQLQNALSHRLALHLPQATSTTTTGASTKIASSNSSDIGKDPLRERVEQSLQSFLRDVMTSVSKNVLINGLDPRPSDIAKGIMDDGHSGRVAEVFEPFDVALQQAVQREYAAVEDHIHTVTTLRRTAPQAIVQHAKRKAEEAQEQVERSIVAGGDDVGEVEVVGGERKRKSEEDEGLEVKVARMSEVVATYEKSVTQLANLRHGVGTVAAKIDRAKEVLEHLVSTTKTTTT
ncbi:hypothetical protein PYCC9005_004047 [Savitreella phatthalungensis]